MKKISILEWNLHFATDGNTTLAPFVQKYLEDFDILILTEVMNNESLKKTIECLDGYEEPFVSFDHGANQIVIVAKKALQPKLVFNHLPNCSMDNFPDFLHIEIVFDEQKYQIIGGRILSIPIDNKSEALLVRDYIERREQFESLANHIKRYSNVILLGDMNSGKIRGDSQKNYDDVKHLYEKTPRGEPSLLKYFNFHMMKKILGDQFTLEEIQGEPSSWGLSYDPKYNGPMNYGTIKNDHLITSKNIKVIQKSYSWDFVRNNEQEYKDMFIINQRKRNKISHGYPDHAMLKTIILLEN